MIEPQTSRRLIGQSLFVGVGMFIMFLRILPLSPGAIRLPGPDLMLCLTFAWVLRRPEQVPAILIAALFLVEDLLLLRPLGLHAFVVLMATEALRTREPRWRDQAFVFEWLRVGTLMLLMIIGERLIMAVMLIPMPALGFVSLQFLATIAAYPVVVLAAHWLLGLRRTSPAEAETLRTR